MLNFAVGPVNSYNEILDIGGSQIPYFRTSEFSETVKECEETLKEFFGATKSSKVVLLTGSGTSAMECSVINTLTHNDKALVVNGGTFGKRFCEICDIHNVPYTSLDVEYGKTLHTGDLLGYEGKGYTAFLVNLGETSTGVLYDLELISSFCKRNNLFLIVDCISSFLCDETDMQAYGVNVAITGSQKALALAPGLSIICLDEKAQQRVLNTQVRSLYFDLKSYLKNAERGQTPFTPAVGIVLQLNKRLKMIKESGGIKAEINVRKEIANYFRERLANLPVERFAEKSSNAVTSLILKNAEKSAYRLFEVLKDDYGIFVCPNGGELKERVFRVGHIGNVTKRDYDILLAALKELADKRII